MRFVVPVARLALGALFTATGLGGFLGLFPLALALLAPGVISIALYHLLLDPAFLWIVPVVVGLEGCLLWAYRGSFRGVLARDARPGA